MISHDIAGALPPAHQNTARCAFSAASGPAVSPSHPAALPARAFISGGEVGADVILEVASALSAGSRIRSLSIVREALTGQSLSAAAQLLSADSPLEELRLDYCSLGDDGAVALSARAAAAHQFPWHTRTRPPQRTQLSGAVSAVRVVRCPVVPSLSTFLRRSLSAGAGPSPPSGSAATASASAGRPRWPRRSSSWRAASRSTSETTGSRHAAAPDAAAATVAAATAAAVSALGLCCAVDNFHPAERRRFLPLGAAFCVFLPAPLLRRTKEPWRSPQRCRESAAPPPECPRPPPPRAPPSHGCFGTPPTVPPTPPQPQRAAAPSTGRRRAIPRACHHTSARARGTRAAAPEAPRPAAPSAPTAPRGRHPRTPTRTPTRTRTRTRPRAPWPTCSSAGTSSAPAASGNCPERSSSAATSWCAADQGQKPRKPRPLRPSPFALRPSHLSRALTSVCDKPRCAAAR